MKTINVDRVRGRVGAEACAHCGAPAQTFVLNAEETVFVCYGHFTTEHARQKNLARGAVAALLIR